MVPHHYFNKAIVDLEQDYYLGQNTELTLLNCNSYQVHPRTSSTMGCSYSQLPHDPSILRHMG